MVLQILFIAQPLQEQFDKFVLPNLFILIVGTLEIMGIVGTQISLLNLWASLELVFLVIGAIHKHIKVKHPINKSAPAGIILL
ncbi:hypothetical protein DMA11_05410 [Marinilabiliaceae bacterium JC017]|nr:hypothetical protein DMA11_05410 [Marinilabiliaceae bacterium JC017]